VSSSSSEPGYQLPPIPHAGLVAPDGQQERDDHVSEAVWVLPEEQMAQLREDHELGARDAVREQLAVAGVDHGVLSALQDQRSRADARLP